MSRRRSIRAVFRVQCGKCRGWLSRTPDYVPGTDVQPHHNETLATAERAWLWPGEGAARRAALAAGWRPDHTQPPGSGVLLCPACSTNPLGIVLPPDPCPNCLHVHRLGILCGNLTTGYACKCMDKKPKENRRWTT